LLLRSAEGKPFFASISQYSRSYRSAGLSPTSTCPLPSASYSAFYNAPYSAQRQRALGALSVRRGYPRLFQGKQAGGGPRRREGGRIPLAAAARARGPCLPWRRVVRASLLAREENLGAMFCHVLACPGGKWSERPCLPGRRILAMFCDGLACPGGKWSERSCLPGRKVVRAFLLALEESGPCVLACPGGELGVRVLLALEEDGPCVLACPGGESWSKLPIFFPRQIGAIRWLGRLNKHYI
jgi:hypothetical protein